MRKPETWEYRVWQQFIFLFSFQEKIYKICDGFKIFSIDPLSHLSFFIYFWQILDLPHRSIFSFLWRRDKGKDGSVGRSSVFGRIEADYFWGWGGGCRWKKRSWHCFKIVMLWLQWQFIFIIKFHNGKSTLATKLGALSIGVCTRWSVSERLFKR